MSDHNLEQTRRVSAGDADSGRRLDRFLADAFADLSRSRLKALIESGHVRVGGTKITDPAYRVKPGERCTLALPPAAPAAPEAQPIALDVVYEDDALIVIDKPAGLVVHPAPGNPDRTLVNALIAHCGESLSGIGGVRRPGIVHRIDKDTSGLMVAAKTDRAHEGLARQFAAHAITRAYVAIVVGCPAPAAGVIDGNIGRDPRNRKRMAVVARGGKPARTHYRLERAFGLFAGIVRCRLETGRTHQIRVHLAHRGHPLVGDSLYGRNISRRLRDAPAAAREAILSFPRQALHAATLGFRHPLTGAEHRFEAACPADLRRLAALLAEATVTLA